MCSWLRLHTHWFSRARFGGHRFCRKKLVEQAAKELGASPDKSGSGSGESTTSPIIDYYALHNLEEAKSILWAGLPLSRVRKYLGIKVGPALLFAVLLVPPRKRIDLTPWSDFVLFAPVFMLLATSWQPCSWQSYP